MRIRRQCASLDICITKKAERQSRQYFIISIALKSIKRREAQRHAYQNDFLKSQITIEIRKHTGEFLSASYCQSSCLSLFNLQTSILVQVLAKLKEKILPEAKNMIGKVGRGEGSNYPSSIAKVYLHQHRMRLQ